MLNSNNISTGKLEAVKALIEGGSDINAKIHNKQTALHLATKEGISFDCRDLTSNICISIETILHIFLLKSFYDIYLRSSKYCKIFN